LSEKGLATLSRQGLLFVKGTSLETCSDFLFGKQHRVSFRTYLPHRRPHVLDLIHTDVYTMGDKSISGCSYFVTFIDDHSRKVWDFVLKSKDQVLDVFKHLHASVERETDKLFKCVRADYGGEYMVLLRIITRSMASSLRRQFQRHLSIMELRRE